jgi:hypothetical protein
MNSHAPQQLDADLVADLQEILTLIALASAVIASPKTHLIVGRFAAVLIHNAAMAWAELLTAENSVIGGAV